MWSKLEEIFVKLGLPYSRQGSYDSSEDYPASFFTFWNSDTPEESYYDNTSTKAVWIWYIYFYTKNASIFYSKMDEFIALAKKKGFITEGRGNDIPSDRPDYFGRVVRIKFIENYNN